MRLPRDVSGADLADALTRMGYQIDHQTGSHIRLTTQRGGEHHVTVPAHDSLRVGTLNSILRAVSQHLGMSRPELLTELFG